MLEPYNILHINHMRQNNFVKTICIVKKHTEIIDEELDRIGRSRAWLASQMGVSRQTLNNFWYNADGILPYQHIEKIDSILGIDVHGLRKLSARKEKEVTAVAEEPPEEYTRTITLNFTPEELRAILTERDQRTRTMEQDIAELKRIIQEMKDQLK